MSGYLSNPDRPDPYDDVHRVRLRARREAWVIFVELVALGVFAYALVWLFTR